ncbi:unnamed protein product [Adineta steineri]|uniref:Uncharacterized protein n=1 Tax=Adineta steineri TaxID=433720 RepID=A0A819ZWV1_9BILA|nr:unnamed protein product [Adineta steineri]CAF3894850.1 unnamed protein product [Adineta steineri]CAF4180879.1 unnamed protein product [Adineta steineri]
MYYINFIFILIIYVQINAQSFPFDTIVTFGDSNTDNGNVYNLTNHQWPIVSPYYEGRFTNGLIWLDKLKIPCIKNYAYGDATIDNDNLLVGFTGPNRTLVPGIRQQIVDYLAVNDINNVDLSRTLYVIWASGNEYFIDSNISSDIVVTALLTTVYDLLVVGIKYLIIMNLLPLQLYPGMNLNQNLTTLVINHNNRLISNITQIKLEYPHVSIQIFDIYSLIKTILSNNSLFNFNKVNACWNISNYSIISQCRNPSEYVFIDKYHFTSSIHEIIADNIQQFISSSLSISLKTFSHMNLCIFIFIIKIY